MRLEAVASELEAAPHAPRSHPRVGHDGSSPTRRGSAEREAGQYQPQRVNRRSEPTRWRRPACTRTTSSGTLAKAGAAVDSRLPHSGAGVGRAALAKDDAREAIDAPSR